MRFEYSYGPENEPLPGFFEALGGPISYLKQLTRRVRHQLRTEPAWGTWSSLAAALFVLLGGAYFLTILWELPTYEDLRDARYAEGSVVLTADGKELTRYNEKNRKWVALKQINPVVVKALIDTEDHRFYEHPGIDVQRLFGSMVRTVGGEMQGGSTITMQYARNAFEDISDDLTITRKIKEWIVSLQLEALFTKDEILEMYLNTVPFLYNAYGIEAAAQTYFQKSAADLNTKEAATLVGMLKGTVLYNPVRNPESSFERRNVVLMQMVRRGDLSQEEYDQLSKEKTRLRFKRITNESNLAPYFTEHLRQWLDDWAQANGRNPYTDGLRVYSTIDSRLQAAAEAAVKKVGDELQAVADVEWARPSAPGGLGSAGAYKSARRGITPFAYLWESRPELIDVFLKQTTTYQEMIEQGMAGDSALQRLKADEAFVDSIKAVHQRVQTGFIAIDPRNGAVKAWVGGRDFARDHFDHVADAKRQPGSTFKPFVYTAALESGFSPDEAMRDVVVEYDDPRTGKRWKPENSGRASGAMMSLRNALAYSKNTITAQLTKEIGPQKVVEYAHKMGIKSELDPVLSIGLGTSDVTLLEMAGAYTTIAGGGIYHEPMMVTRIEDRHGNVLATFEAEPKEVLPKRTADTILDMLRGVIDFGTGQRIRSYGYSGDLAGKTGTTQNGADGWFMLMHPQLVMGSWVGFSSPSITFRSDWWAQGAHNALLVVGEFLQRARLPNEQFEASGYEPYVPQPDTTVSDTTIMEGDEFDPMFDEQIFEDGNEPIEEPTPGAEEIPQIEEEAGGEAEPSQGQIPEP